jgi:chromate transporter
MRALEVFGAALRLGLTSFGGPVAHLGYFREEYVRRRGWLDDRTYAELVALCQLLPGPASSELGIAIGVMRAGLFGGLLAWAAFTLPSAILLTAFAFAASALPPDGLRWLHGLQLVAVAIVAQAVWTMGRSLAPDRPRLALALAAALVALAAPGAAGQVGTIAAGGLVGALLLRRVGAASPAERSGPEGAAPGRAGPGQAAAERAQPERTHPERVSDAAVPVGRWLGAGALALLVVLLVGLPLLRRFVHDPGLAAFDSFFRSGALVFGGGHVVLPLLRTAVVTPGWVTEQQFLTGYGAAQAVPGPLFTFSAYLGATAMPSRALVGAAVALVGIFLPGMLVLAGTLPFWDVFRRKVWAQAAMKGINASVVGLLGAALYDPVFTTAVHRHVDFVIALSCFVLLVTWRLPPLAVVALGAAAGIAVAAIGDGWLPGS